MISAIKIKITFAILLTLYICKNGAVSGAPPVAILALSRPPPRGTKRFGGVPWSRADSNRPVGSKKNLDFGF
jgi:hypothetical protein